MEAYAGLPDSRLANTGRMITSFLAVVSERVGVGIDVIVMLLLLSVLVIARVPKFGWNVLWMLLVYIASQVGVLSAKQPKRLGWRALDVAILL